MTTKKPKINTGALFLAACIFVDSTALGYWRVAQLHMPNNTGAQPAFVLPDSAALVTPFPAGSKDSQFALPQPDGGPDQPEVKSFTPISTSDMVDPFTGDFSYNIPLMDVDGYPINIAYNAGVTMDQEASWVGLGWNLNPGVVNRSMRGLPDEFNGLDTVKKTMNMRRNWTVGFNSSVDYEFYGIGDKKKKENDTMFHNTGLSLNASLGISYNNYAGFSSSIGLGIDPSWQLSDQNKSELNAGLGFSGSSTGGASIKPNVGFSSKDNENKQKEKITKLNLGTQFNSRAGLENATVSYSRTTNKSQTESKALKDPNGVSNATTTSTITKSTTLPIKSSFNFGQSTYTPQISLPFNSAGGTFSFKLGPDIVGNDLHVQGSGFYNAQWLRYDSISVPAFGFMNLQSNNIDSKSMLDFNRENDGAFTKNTPALAIPNLTYDLFSISGQGIAGSYRAVRKDIGHVFDPTMKNGSVNGSFGFEAGMGTTFKAGIDVSLTYDQSSSGDWDEGGNKAFNVLKFKDGNWSFREANELAVNADPTHFQKIGGSDAVRFDVKNHRRIDNILDDSKGNFYSSEDYAKSGEDKRNQVLYTLTNAQLKDGLGIEPLHPLAHAWESSNFDHHIGQFTVLNVEGSRYVYGIAAYSHFQEDVSFNVGSTKDTVSNSVSYVNNLVSYEAGVDNSVENERGIDHYYNKVHTPDFAHSYLLTSVLNADYVDADNIKGPSKGDLGGYLHFSYRKIDDYKWRNPINQNNASFDEGLNTDNTDDKGHYIYGKKELWYVDTIKSKNHIAIFYMSPRQDGLSVIDENGGLTSAVAMQKLDKIVLYSLPEYEADPTTATPLKTVHFEYSYELCPGYIGHENLEGKLTLKKIYFTYQGSNKGKYTPYVFQYGQRFLPDGAVEMVINPNYNVKEMDRWNTYKNQEPFSGDIAGQALRPCDFPYVGLDKAQVDKNATAWNLTTISLPSGGKIQVDYESDDYAYVQHKRANQMFKIIGVQKVNEVASDEIVSGEGATSLSEDENKNGYIYVELMPDPSSPSGYNEHISDYVSAGQQIYFRALMRFADGKYDFVPGYAYVSDSSDDLEIVSIGSQRALRIKLKGETLMDNGNADYNPIAVAAIQFARMHLSKFIPPSSNSNYHEEANLPGLMESLGGALTSYQELIIGPNKALWADNIGNNIVINHSWVRLQNPNRKKLGGGHRVKQIRMYDAWNAMTEGQMAAHYYGQEYTYTQTGGGSSGVASYEPQIGGDENPWRQPLAADKKVLLAPDVKNYQELPFGEQFFPSAGVGYAMVTVQDLKRDGVKRTATGKVVHEFYTAKDFPTIAKYTTIDMKRFKLPVFAFFFSSMVDEMAASQGFVVENNDMHGKAKRTSVYAEGQSEPITKVEYVYLSDNIQQTSSLPGVSQENAVESFKHLSNEVTTIAKNGTIGKSTVGLDYEAVADFRKSASNSIYGSANYNSNFTLPALFVPVILGSGSYERTAFRSATFTKVIERFGILSKTIATDLGSVVETKNLAYDAETGTVLLTQTTTDFNDTVYNFTYPAHWYYDQMGQAYQNVGVSASDISFVSGGTSQLNASRFTKGDELAILLDNSGEYVRGWVTEASPSGVFVLLKDGTPLQGLVRKLKVLRSGRRNLQTTPIGTLTLRDNPLDNLQGNLFEKVLQAGSVEYSDEWRTFCECFLDENSASYTSNPYVLGTKGTWRPQASYVHLSGRAQTYQNGNSNIREDGMFTSFNPFYTLNNGKWQVDRENWTYTSSVVEFSPFGQALETVDALGRYSSSVFGYNQTLPTAVAANTRYRQLGFDGFEDYDFINCSDNHFKLGASATVENNEAHTGRNSIRVANGSSALFTAAFTTDCEPVTCTLTAKVEVTKVDKVNMTKNSVLYPVQGTAPYQFTYEVLQGTATVELTDAGDGLLIYDALPQNSNPTKIRINITDAAGCSYSVEL